MNKTSAIALIKWVLLIFVTGCYITGMAQTSDFILLKRRGQTVQTFFPGSKVFFTSTNGVYIEAFINSIRNDSLYLKQFTIRQVPTALGFYALDTSYYYSRYHVKQIKSLGHTTGRRFDWGSSGGVLMGGGVLLTTASGIMYLADRKKFSPELLVAAVGLTGAGYLLLKVAGKCMVIGKKYSLEYIKASENNKP